VTSVTQLTARPPAALICLTISSRRSVRRAEDHGRAPFGQQPGGGLANAAGRAGDGDDLPADAVPRDPLG
jgi:hypothetical protein